MVALYLWLREYDTVCNIGIERYVRYLYFIFKYYSLVLYVFYTCVLYFFTISKECGIYFFEWGLCLSTWKHILILKLLTIWDHNMSLVVIENVCEIELRICEISMYCRFSINGIEGLKSTSFSNIVRTWDSIFAIREHSYTEKKGICWAFCFMMHIQCNCLCMVSMFFISFQMHAAWKTLI